MSRLTPVVLLVALLAACSSSSHSSSAPPPTSAPVTTTTVPACTITPPKKLERIDLTVGGKPRYALVHIPSHWDGKHAVPLVLSFHGLGASAANQKSTDGFVAHSDK